MQVVENMVSKITTRKTNKEKILDHFKENPIRITTTKLAEKTGIDIKNISRYLKQLESENKISRETIQDGKIRVVYISLTIHKKNITTRNQVKKPKSTPKTQAKTIKENRNHQNVVFLEQMSQEIKIFGRTIPINKVREIARKTLENSRNMIKGIRTYQSAWENRYKRYLEEKPNNFLIDEFESMQKTLDLLKDMKELNEKLKNRKGV